MTNIIDLSVTTLTSHHCTMFIGDKFLLLPQERDKAACAYSPLQGWGQYMSMVSWHSWGTFHETWSCKLQKWNKNHEQVFTNMGPCEKQTKNHMDQIQSGTHLFNTICSPLGFKTYMTHNSCSGWTPASFATKILAMEKEREFIPMHYRPIASHALQDSYSISTKRRS